MKKKIVFLLVLLILGASVLLSSCTLFDKILGKDDDASFTAGYPKSLVGCWYSEEEGVVFDFAQDGNMNIYMMTTGYFEYDSVVDCTYSYQPSTGTLTICSEDMEDDVWTVVASDSNTLALTNSSGSAVAFKASDSLPPEHAVYNFFDYSTLDYSILLTLPTYTGLIFHTSLGDLCFAYALSNYWDDATPTVQVVERTAQKGDYAVIDFTGLLDGVAFENGSGTDAGVWIHAQSGFVDGFADGIVGHSVGETFDVTLTFPENYYENLAGKEVVFRMTLKALYNGIPTDEEVATATENAYETFSSYCESFRADLEEDVKAELIADGIFAEVVFKEEIPFLSYAFFLQYYQDMYHYYAAYYGTDYDTLISYYGLTDDILTEQCQSIAKEYMSVHAIALAEGITYTDDQLQEQVDKALASYMSDYGYTETEALEIVNNNDLPTIRAELIYDLVTNWLFANNTFVD